MRLKTIENCRTSQVKSSRGRLKSFTKVSTVVISLGKILVFKVGGRLWEVVAHGGSTVARVTLLS